MQDVAYLMAVYVVLGGDERNMYTMELSLQGTLHSTSTSASFLSTLFIFPLSRLHRQWKLQQATTHI